MEKNGSIPIINCLDESNYILLNLKLSNHPTGPGIHAH